MIGGKARPAGLLVSLALLLGACTAQQREALSGDDGGINTPPTRYKADIAAAMHSYLNDPTGIRDAAVSEPALKTMTGLVTRYVACVQFNPKKNTREYAGVRTIAAVFLAGRFDHFVDNPKTECTGAVFTPFPELQKLPP